MINMLLVDDEVITVNLLKGQIDWGKLGIDNVYTAFSMHQARQRMNEAQIDIMICDIEMPQGSGIDLLGWVRANRLNTECIFLTGHADFSYARQAMELESMSYLVKPIPFAELEKVVGHAVEKVWAKRTNEDNASAAKIWQENKGRVAEQFWRDIVKNAVEPGLGSIYALADRLGIKLDRSAVYMPVLIASKKNIFRSVDRKKWDVEQEIYTLVAGHLPGAVCRPQELDDRRLAVILGLPAGNEIDRLNLKEQFSGLLEELIKALKIDFSIIAGKFASVEALPAQVSHLMTLEAHNVMQEGCVVMSDGILPDPAKYQRADIGLWETLFEAGKTSQLTEAVERYLQSCSERRQLDSGVLTQLQHDYLQMVYSVFESRGIPANSIFLFEESGEYFTQASLSIGNMKEWIAYITGKAVYYTGMEKAAQSVIEQVCDYVAKNLHQPLSRQEIARSVNLNPEYLSRLFHREKECSLIEYIQNEKMKAAQQMLAGTNLTVSEVAANLGYSNFAYFSQLFRRTFGMSPIDYRKTYK